MTGTKSLKICNKTEIIKTIKDQVAAVNNPYDLVRMEDIEIANGNNKHIIAEMLLELNEFSNIARKMSEYQVIETVRMLIKSFPRLSLQEYQVFFNRIKAGYYGQLYDSLDGIKIMAFMRKFYKELLNAYHEFKEENHQRLKADEQHRDL